MGQDRITSEWWRRTRPRHSGSRACAPNFCPVVPLHSHRPTAACPSRDSATLVSLSSIGTLPTSRSSPPDDGYLHPLAKSVVSTQVSLSPPQAQRVNSYLGHFCTPGSPDRGWPRLTPVSVGCKKGYIHPPNTSVPTMCQALCGHSGCSNVKPNKNPFPPRSSYFVGEMYR